LILGLRIPRLFCWKVPRFPGCSAGKFSSSVVEGSRLERKQVEIAPLRTWTLVNELECDDIKK
jgi:hypothetical protein